MSEGIIWAVDMVVVKMVTVEVPGIPAIKFNISLVVNILYSENYL